jgi:type II secretory pathway pseudopilin PulG
MNPKPSAKQAQGYVLLALLLMVALLFLTASVAVPRALVQGQREKEEEMVFRGEQYTRAIGLYYKRYGRFPQKLEELVEPKNNVRFLRQLYKNPTSRDGAWRLLRVAPDGTILGSVMLRSRLGLIAPGAGGSLLPTTGAGSTGAPQRPQRTPGGGAATTLAPPPETAPEVTPLEPDQQVSPPPGQAPEEQPGIPPETPQPPSQEQPPQTEPPPPESQPLAPARQEVAPAPTVPEISEAQAIGSGIIGVAGKSSRPSVRVYRKGTRYVEWEFLFDPMAEARQAIERGQRQAQPGLGAQTPQSKRPQQ